MAYQWVSSLIGKINKKLLSGDGDIISTIDTEKNTMNDNIKATLDIMK